MPHRLRRGFRAKWSHCYSGSHWPWMMSTNAAVSSLMSPDAIRSRLVVSFKRGQLRFDRGNGACDGPSAILQASDRALDQIKHAVLGTRCGGRYRLRPVRGDSLVGVGELRLQSREVRSRRIKRTRRRFRRVRFEQGHVCHPSACDHRRYSHRAATVSRADPQTSSPRSRSGFRNARKACW